MNNIFVNRESILSSKKRMTGININYKNKIKLSREKEVIFESRLFNLSYPNYLRKLQNDGAILFKMKNFIDYYFLDNAKINKHVENLNNKIKEFLFIDSF